MTTIVWTVSTIDYEIVNGAKVPTVLHWTCSGEDAEGNTGRYIGTQAITQGDEKAVVTWDDLTEDKALAWLMADMSVVTMDTPEGEPTPSQKDAIEASINAQIAEKANPTRGTGVPWASQEGAPEASTMPAPKTKARAKKDASC